MKIKLVTVSRLYSPNSLKTVFYLKRPRHLERLNRHNILNHFKIYNRFERLNYIVHDHRLNDPLPSQ